MSQEMNLSGLTLADAGIEVCPLQALPGQAWMAKAVHGAAAVFLASPVVTEAERHFRIAAQTPRTFEYYHGRLKLRPEQKTFLVQRPCEALLAWATQPPLLIWISDRVGGGVPALHSAHLWLALVSPPGWIPTMSQTWHRDPYEPGMDRIVKLFWYLQDVDEQAGPFEYLRGTQERVKPTGRALSDRYIQERQPGALDDHPDRVVCCGSKNTIVLADTSGIHRGGLCRTMSRLSATVVYGIRAR